MQNKSKLWITNITKKPLNIDDLCLIIQPFSSVNLLDNKHYHFSIDQINKSIENGTIFRKKKYLSIRKEDPIIIKNNILLAKDHFISKRNHSAVEIKEEVYEELTISDEKYAEENAELAEIDRNAKFIK